MIVNSEQDESLKHTLSITDIYTIGEVDGNKDVIYEVTLNIKSKLPHTVSEKRTTIRMPEVVGTETKEVDDIVMDDPLVSMPMPELIVQDGIAYYKATKKTRYGTVVKKEVEVPTFDIPEAVEETTTVDVEKTEIEDRSYSIEFSTSNIDSSNFVDLADLTEETIIGWIPDEVINPYLSAQASVVITAKDKIVNPSKYDKKRVDLPWTASENNN